MNKTTVSESFRGALTALLKAIGYYAAYRVTRFAVSELFIATVLAARSAGWTIGLGVNNLSMLLSITVHAVFALATLLWFCLRHQPLLPSLGIKPLPLSQAALCILCGCGATVTVGWLYNVIPFPTTWQNEYTDSTAVLFEEYGVLTFVLTVCVAPLMEEVLFRGLLFKRLRTGMPFFAAATLSAAVFAAAHGNLLWALYAFGLGLFLSWLFERTGSLLASVLCHFGFNLIGQLSIGGLSWPFYMAVCALGTMVLFGAVWRLCRMTARTTL